MFLSHEFRPEMSPRQSATVGLRAGSVPDHAAVGMLSRVDNIGASAIKRARGPAARPTVEPIGGSVKRAMDIVISLLALVLLAPLMLVIAALVRVTMGGPVVFAQQRLGVDGRIFTCYKFRTMMVNADEILRRHLATNASAAREWRETRKLRNDPRVGCIGNVLRKSSLDELPQLYNVLLGEMSIVGPRPIVPCEVENYGEHARACFRARPGLTGLWQVSGRNRLSYETRVQLDRYYARKWSIWLDASVILKTVPALLNFKDTA